MSLEILSMLT
ncbi:hypothetical protein GQ607_010698 [Colletotrichum asianum]|uniref:Uncharacterized protein n=1 Tax=Colletotrichum asianum TaxID=702518 RepID=A0A8H3W9Z5_9PEZI|nr:hypothetical protein GQ607_010698 [Colletotrichum asianum]